MAQDIEYKGVQISAFKSIYDGKVKAVIKQGSVVIDCLLPKWIDDETRAMVEAMRYVDDLEERLASQQPPPKKKRRRLGRK